MSIRPKLPDHTTRPTLAQAIAAGNARVNGPVASLILGGGALGYLLFGLTARFFVPFLGGVALAAAWWVVTIPRWWAWAISQGIDPDDLQDVAEAEKLVWPRRSWLYRRGGRFWRHDRKLRALAATERSSLTEGEQ